MTRSEKAGKTFNSGYNCAQSVLSVFAEEYNLDKPTALKLSTGFGGGMGRMQHTCGAVTGAFMVIGLKHGKSNDHEDENQEISFSMVQDFSKKFIEQHGSINCKDIIQCDLQTEEGRKYFQENDLIKTCTECVKTAVNILEEMS
jgi:C_GCAxxG_C_C family probable redox protein